MIRTSKQLKDKIRNLSGGDSTKAQMLIRNYIMERFLERIACSKYKNQFILKGGMLVASVAGLEARATMDIDTTVRSLRLSKENAMKIIEDIMNVEIPDGVHFQMIKISDIMPDHDYPGIRFVMNASLDRLSQAIKIDLSTGDIITPEAIRYSYKLMFEDRYLSLWTYNLETLLAEKLETIMSRGTANTRMRDFYDIHILLSQKQPDETTFRAAFQATSRKRNAEGKIPDLEKILNAVKKSEAMDRSWENYKNSSYFVENLSWTQVMESVLQLAEKIV